MFRYYNEKPIVVKPTTAEIVASLTGLQKLAILNGFALGIKPKTLGYKERIKLAVVDHLYKKINAIEELARYLMRGEVIVTSAVIDSETGEIITPAVYNKVPANAVGLLSEVQDVFSDDFTADQVIAILTKMVEYSKYSGNGTWEYYAENVIKN